MRINVRKLILTVRCFSDHAMPKVFLRAPRAWNPKIVSPVRTSPKSLTSSHAILRVSFVVSAGDECSARCGFRALNGFGMLRLDTSFPGGWISSCEVTRGKRCMRLLKKWPSADNWKSFNDSKKRINTHPKLMVETTNYPPLDVIQGYRKVPRSATVQSNRCQH